ncbi:MAG: class I SAM-dependent methyltransferase [Clostridia bacterium]|nr:class I SAM-dependent methyltransferase [Clostridia bacterium]
MTKRLKEICLHIPKSKALADVGCDHGYCARYALKNGLAEHVYITDISAQSLEKAKTLLRKEIEEGKCVALVGDGLRVLPEECTVLIAGMGGEEIVKILSYDIPPVFLLQPMKNTEKVRRFLVERGCSVSLDYTFEDGKFYDLILGARGGGDRYTEEEFLYGRDNLKNPSPAFLKKLRTERDKIKNYLLSSPSEEEREKLMKRLQEKERLLNEIDGNL